MNREAIILEAKARIREKITKDNFIMFFGRVLEDLKKEKDPNLFGRVKDLYVLIRPYGKVYDHEIYDYLSGDFECKDGMILDDKEKSFVKIFMDDLKKGFHLKNPNVMKGRINGILNKLCEKYLPESINIIEPSLLVRIIAAVGGMERLKDLPSSTIQLIGAEKALFRHVTINKSPPKYGLLYYSRFIQEEKNKGKIARQLANKLAISIKVDYFQKIKPNDETPL